MTIADVDFDLLPEVFSEVYEHLPQLERDLHQLVQNPTSADLLSSTFRHMHTIKGDFGYCRATPIMEFVHLLESVLQSLRDHAFQCSALVAEALVQSMDQVQTMMEVLEQSKQFDTTPRQTLMQHIQQLAQARTQADADQAARNILLVSHDAFLGETSNLPQFPAPSAESCARALALGEQLTAALGKRLPSWRRRAIMQCALVLDLNEHYRRPCNPDILKIAVYWHDVGLLALPDSLWQPPPKPKAPGWPAYASHTQDAASWLLAIAPDCLEAAQIIRQHHAWVNGAGIPASDYTLPPHPGALMLACADLLHEHVAGLRGEEYRRGVLRTLFEVNGGLETRFDAELINAFEIVAHNLTTPTSPN